MSPDDKLTFTRAEVTDMINTILARDPLCAFLARKLNEPPPSPPAQWTPPMSFTHVPPETV